MTEAVARVVDDLSSPAALQVRCTRSEVRDIKLAALEQNKTVSQFLLDCFAAFQERQKPLNKQKVVSLTFSTKELAILELLTDLGYVAYGPEVLAAPATDTEVAEICQSFYKMRRRITLALGAHLNWTHENIGCDRD